MPPASPRDDFQQAMTLHKAGKVAEALTALRRLVAANPRMAEAQFQLGRILTTSGQPAEALPHLAAARAAAPREPAVWRGVLVALAELGDRPGIERFLADLARAPLPPAARAELTTLARRGEQIDLGGVAKASIDRMIRLILAGDGPGALSLTTELHRAHPEVSVVTNGHASALGLVGREDEAIATYRLALTQDPLSPQIRSNFGRYLLSINQPTAAVVQFTRAAELRPNSADQLCLLGNALLAARRPEEALKTLRRARTLAPDNPNVVNFLAVVLREMGQTDEAIALRQRLEELEPQTARTWILAGELSQTRGQIDEARAQFLRAVAIAPEDADPYMLLARTYRFQPDDPLIARMEALQASPTQSPNARIGLGFALAKAYEDAKAYDKVFPVLNKANAEAARRMPFDLDGHRRILDEARELAHRIDLPAIAAANPLAYDPIFVTGLPRSGTTLAEQILASHSAVTGVGEASWIGEVFRAPRAETGRTYGDLFGTQEQIEGAGAAYARIARLEAPKALRIADKGMWNHFLIGLMAAALPRARIVMLKRDPRDNLLSIYKNQFRAAAHPYNTSLRNLAAVYAGYEEIKALWREAFPGCFYDLDYDLLTAEPEAQIRALIDYCGLPFEEAVLAPHRTERDVRTLSVAQVRQPIYRSSVRSWERYRDDLAPLLDALQEFGVELPGD